MFSRAFATQTLASSAIGSPAAVAGPVMAVSHLVQHYAVLSNLAFATIQLALGAGLLWRPAVKAALAGTVAWSLAILVARRRPGRGAEWRRDPADRGSRRGHPLCGHRPAGLACPAR
jgi:hypothetical protein